MSRQAWNELASWSTAAGTAVANTTTETALGSLTIPANYMSDGRVLRVSAFGKISTTGSPTFKWGFRWGAAVSGILLAETEAITQGTGVTNLNWALRAILQVRTNGSSGTALMMGDLSFQTSTTANTSQVFSVSGADAPATATCNFTVDTALSLVGTWSAASASNTANHEIFIIETMN